MIPWNAPAVAALELTLRCPCRCQTCGSHAGAPRARELAHDEWLGVIAALADLGCRRMTLMGGEPLLYPRWPELVAAARGRDVVVDMISSGQGLDEDATEKIRDSGLHAVTLSVDGLAATHDTQRGVPGCFAQTMRAIRLVDQSGLKVGVTSQINQGNLGELEALAPVLEDAGVIGWQLQLTLPIGRAGTHPHLALPPERMPELLQILRRLARRPGLRPHLTDNIGYCTGDDLELRTIQGGFPRPWLGCRAGLDALGIASDGRVKGCLALPDTASRATCASNRLPRCGTTASDLPTIGATRPRSSRVPALRASIPNAAGVDARRPPTRSTGGPAPALTVSRCLRARAQDKAGYVGVTAMHLPAEAPELHPAPPPARPPPRHDGEECQGADWVN